ncbi:hypothetical protein KEJ37_03295 [Candidatus Bathyarchaeota archaeon]|nr:hypothetical protein [Candidatus Bathyarchaeota archaeon]
MNENSMFKKLSKRELFEVLKNMALAYSSSWFKSEWIAVKKLGIENFQGREFAELFKEFGAREAKILVERSIVTGRNADSIIKALKLSHWALFESITLEKLSDSMVRMRTINCSRQKYAIKKLGIPYPCRDIGFPYESRSGFVRAINPSAEVERVFCPPDQRPNGLPENVSCEWIIRIP